MKASRKVTPGRFHPLGATLTPEGVNFALYSERAEGVDLLLFDRPDSEPSEIITLTARDRFVWHALVHGLKAGQLYGYRVRGPWQPEKGLRFNPAKVLLDPYAKAVTGKFHNRENILLAYDPLSPHRDLSKDLRDNAAQVPKGIVVDDRFDWQGVVPPDHLLDNLIIYEVHLKGFTAHPSAGVKSPGTYAGFIEKIPHLKRLGVNAVELLPIHEIFSEDFLLNKGRVNYWGYNTASFFAPESSYSSGQAPGAQVAEFKTLVRELHRAGIEVILDVVYNHTAEGSELGTTMSWRGIDNTTYYSLCGPPGMEGRHYQNYTGCGNSLNASHPAVIRMIMDSLRYWTEVMHVDGFRFDLASALGRDGGGFRSNASFFDAVSQDPILSRVKMIAEPWDLGTYQVGNFPVDWSEWNGRFRDTARRFVKGDAGMLREIGWRLSGSADLYADDGRSASNSINFTTCHDGFTLHDLVSYNGKNNHANGEDNRDGTDDNNSWNCGAEGPTDDHSVLRLRRQLAKNHICLLLFSSGTPMLLGGDEFLRTQQGNNNGYCQDNHLSWFDWDLLEKNADFFEFCRKAIALTHACPSLQRRKFLTGTDPDDNRVPDVAWYGPDLAPPEWGNPNARILCHLLDEPLFFINNHGPEMQTVALPSPGKGLRWHRVIDTSLDSSADFAEPGQEVPLDPGDRYIANPRSVVVLSGIRRVPIAS
jgi:glycogen operon protein